MNAITNDITEQDRAQWRQWSTAAQQPAVHEALRSVNQAVDDAVAQRQPICEASGRCCKFESYGHRLYVTGLEIAWFLNQAPEPPAEDVETNPLLRVIQDACVYQVNGLCSVHTVRPFGCRVFFCDPTSTQWQNELYERSLQRVRDVHTEHGLPYRYLEWRAGLVEARAILT